MEKKKLFFGNLNYSVTETEIRDILSPFGEVTSIRLFQDKGFGFVEFATEEGAQGAINELNDKDFKGRPLKLDFARPREARPRR